MLVPRLQQDIPAPGPTKRAHASALRHLALQVPVSRLRQGIQRETEPQNPQQNSPGRQTLHL